MFTRNNFPILRKRIIKTITMLIVLVTLFFMGGHLFIKDSISDIIRENDVEDQNLLFTTVLPARPNVGVLYDNSQSSGTSFGGGQIGRWNPFNFFAICTETASIGSGSSKTTIGVSETCSPTEIGGSGINSSACRASSAHCVSNAAGITREQPDGTFMGCGSSECSTSLWGTCDDPDDFSNFLDCTEANYPGSIIPTVYSLAVPVACDTSLIALPGVSTVTTKAAVLSACTTASERAHAAAGIENLANYLANQVDSALYPLTCGGSVCGDLDTDNDGDIDINDLDTSGDTLYTILDGVDPSCNISGGDFNSYMQCMGGRCTGSGLTNSVCTQDLTQNLRIQPGINTCTSGKQCGHANFGSARLDIVTRTFFDFLDADPSVDDYVCVDDGQATAPSVDLVFDGASSNISCEDYFYHSPFRYLRDITSPDNADFPDTPDSGLTFRAGLNLTPLASSSAL